MKQFVKIFFIFFLLLLFVYVYYKHSVSTPDFVLDRTYIRDLFIMKHVALLRDNSVFSILMGIISHMRCIFSISWKKKKIENKKRK